MTYLAPVPKLQFFDSNGDPLAGGLLYTYAAGTSTPLSTYTDSTGSTPNTNPVVLNSRGEANVWLGTSLYKMVLKTSVGVEIWTVDNVEGSTSIAALAAANGSSIVGFIQYATGSVARTVESKLRDRVSIEDFGGVGDGVTDNSTALQNAINYLTANTKVNATLPCIGTIEFGPREYYFSQAIELKRVVNLEGSSSGFTAGASTMFTFAAGQDGIRVQRANTTGRTQALVSSTTGADGSKIQNIFISQKNYVNQFIDVVDYNTVDGLVLAGSNTCIALPIGTAFTAVPYASSTVNSAILSSVLTTTRQLGISQVVGTFQIGETVTASPSGATGVIGYLGTAPGMAMYSVVGTFAVNDTVTGGTSAATALVSSVNTTSLYVFGFSGITGASPTIGTTYIPSSKSGIGVLLRARSEVSNVFVSGFPEHGMCVVANSGAIGLRGNANNFLLQNVVSSSNGGHGLYVLGDDANAGQVNKISCQYNGGYGLWDRSFLRNQYNCTHCASNAIGAMRGSSVFSGVYTEGSNTYAPWRRRASDFGANASILGDLIFGEPYSTGTDNLEGLSNNLFGLYSSNKLQTNGLSFSNATAAPSGQLSISTTGTVAYPLFLENYGNAGAGRGTFISISGPSGNLSSRDYGSIGIAGTGGTKGSYVSLNVESTVALSATVSGGTGASLHPVVNSSGVLTSVLILNGGTGFTSGTAVTFSGGGSGTSAAATAYAWNGVITKIVVTNGGSGYTPTSREGARFYATYARAGGAAYFGDVAATLTIGTSSQTNIWNTPLTTNRAVTLSATGAAIGDKFRITRQTAASGVSNLNVGTGPLKALAAGQWCDVEYDGSAWVLVAAGSL